MFNLAIKWNIYDSNPTKNVTLPRIHNERVVRVEIEDINKLLQALDHYTDQPVANLIKFALFTGLRRSEIFKLKWKDINLPKGWLYIRDPKGGRDQVIPLNDSALGVLAQQEKETEYVFPGQYGKQRKNIRPHWIAIRTQAGLPSDLHFHDLRHVYATILASSGEVDLYTLQKLLTHKTAKMTQRYAHIIEERLRKATCVMDRVLKRGRV